MAGGFRCLLESNQSGAGRFTDFLLPPLTFHEFLQFTEKIPLIEDADGLPLGCRATDIEALNESFLQYLNIGGYPEAVFNPTIRSAPERFINSDIIDKVLLRDLPQLYGIRDIQELNRLLSQSSGVATIRRWVPSPKPLSTASGSTIRNSSLTSTMRVGRPGKSTSSARIQPSRSRVGAWRSNGPTGRPTIPSNSACDRLRQGTWSPRKSTRS